MALKLASANAPQNISWSIARYLQFPFNQSTNIQQNLGQTSTPPFSTIYVILFIYTGPNPVEYPKRLNSMYAQEVRHV